MAAHSASSCPSPCSHPVVGIIPYRSTSILDGDLNSEQGWDSCSLLTRVRPRFLVPGCVLTQKAVLINPGPVSSMVIIGRIGLFLSSDSANVWSDEGLSRRGRPPHKRTHTHTHTHQSPSGITPSFQCFACSATIIDAMKEWMPRLDSAHQRGPEITL